MPKRDPKRFQPSSILRTETDEKATSLSSAVAPPTLLHLPSIMISQGHAEAEVASHNVLLADSWEAGPSSSLHTRLMSATDPDSISGQWTVFAADSESGDTVIDPAQQLGGFVDDESAVTEDIAETDEFQSTEDEFDLDGFGEATEDTLGLRRVPIPEAYWNSIPSACLRRMLEFESVRDEFRDTFQRDPDPTQLDSAPRLALEDIIDQVSLNSRELQSAKETLYRAALALTLERFDYQLRPSVGGNGTAADFTANRSEGASQSTLGLPTNFQVERMLFTGGDFLASFANNVVLTFNGADGFMADISSDLFFGLSQSLLQYDVRLERLTIAERNVVYAARDFARFRRELFVRFAEQYYALIQDFRDVEISSQNYFTLVRQFNQGEAEFRAGLSSRIQLDQIEQRVIEGRQDLLSRCTGLDNTLDRLKIQIGLPTEEPMNIDLTELFLLTLRDELAVNGELVDRVRNRLLRERQKQFPAVATLVSAGAVLVDRMRDSNELRNRLGEETPSSDELLDVGLRLQTEAALLDVDDATLELQSELESETPSQPIVFQRRLDIVDEQLEVIQLQLQRAARRNSPKRIAMFVTQAKQLALRARQIGERFDQLIVDAQLAGLPQLLEDSVQLESDITATVEGLDGLLNRETRQRTPEQKLHEAIVEVDELLRISESYRLSSHGGLVPIEIDMDEAMLTALVRRFDLLTARGGVADDWRQIKFAGDELRSVLNLSASQSLSTRSRHDSPFDFTVDNSTTSIAIELDAPFNRRAQRNAYRNTLINYQATLRNLALLEDNIKLSVREDLRFLALNREQYINSIASTALAFERVVSTELELRLGIGSVAARDFLESQQAYTRSLSGTAGNHIAYIRSRLSLFLDLELLEVGDDGFWHQLYDEDVQPMPYYQFPGYALPAYGTLHPCLKYSPEIRRMLCVPTGTASIYQKETSDQQPQPFNDLPASPMDQQSQPSTDIPTQPSVQERQPSMEIPSPPIDPANVEPEVEAL